MKMVCLLGCIRPPYFCYFSTWPSYLLPLPPLLPLPLTISLDYLGKKFLLKVKYDPHVFPDRKAKQIGRLYLEKKRVFALSSAPID